MEIKNYILIISVLLLIISCVESEEEQALREFGEEMDELSEEWNREIDKAEQEFENVMDKLK